jgi:phage tail sheath gpL-like
VRINYRGIANNEVTPPGVTVAFAVGTAGATNPVFTTLFSNLGTTTFDYIAFPYTDTASLTAIEALLSDQSGRWSAIEALYGHVFSAYRGTVSGRSTFGVSNNNQHLSILGYYDSPTAAWVEAADWCGAHAINYRVNPAVGIVGQALNLLPPPLASQDTPGEQNVLLYDGMSTFNVNEAGQSVIDRSITTYQTNQAGQIDDSYLNTGLLFQAMFVARYLAIQVLSQFLNKILVDDGNIIGPGSPAVTPSLIFQAVCGMYAYLCTQYIVQDSQTFAKNGYAQKGTKGQVLLYLPIDFADAVIQVPALIQFQQTT